MNELREYYQLNILGHYNTLPVFYGKMARAASLAKIAWYKQKNNGIGFLRMRGVNYPYYIMNNCVREVPFLAYTSITGASCVLDESVKLTNYTGKLGNYIGCEYNESEMTLALFLCRIDNNYNIVKTDGANKKV